MIRNALLMGRIAITTLLVFSSTIIAGFLLGAEGTIIVPGLTRGTQNSPSAFFEDQGCTESAVAQATANKTTPPSKISEYYSEKRPASNALDTDQNTRWTSKGNGSWIGLDLGDEKSICGVSISWFLGDRRSYDFAIDATNDGVNFTRIYNNVSSGVTNSSEPYDFSDVSARGLRITGEGNTRNNYTHISEISVYTAS